MKKTLFRMLEWYMQKSRRVLWLPALFIAAGVQAATPYVYVPFTKTATYPNGAPLPVSDGILWNPSFNQSVNFTNVAVVYHPVTSGSIVDSLFPTLAPYIPAESWSLNLGVGGGNGSYIGGPGFTLNLLDTVRQQLSTALASFSNPTIVGISKAIAPSATTSGSLNLTVGPQWTAPLMVNGIVPPLNQLRITNHWYFGVGYAF
jgi:hypothetical protein